MSSAVIWTHLDVWTEEKIRWERAEGGVHGGVIKSPSGVDGDDLTSTSAHQEDPIQTFSQNLEERHVWDTITVKEKLPHSIFK